ncbi:hypothetical protein PR001_g9361 [Phytophthora rubi]|nr:hypothetical protein PR001_g9361 [Phytophthora rubi]
MAVKLVSADVSVSVQNSATNSLSESSGILYSGEKTYGTLRRTSHPVPAETTHPPPTNTKPPSTIHSSNGCHLKSQITIWGAHTIRLCSNCSALFCLNLGRPATAEVDAWGKRKSVSDVSPFAISNNRDS